MRNFENAKVGYRCKQCRMGFRVGKKSQEIGEHLMCPDCKMPFWSVTTGVEKGNVTIVGIEPETVDLEDVGYEALPA